MSKQYLYDVLSDYSLKLCTNKKIPKGKYRWDMRTLFGETLSIGTHIEYNEIHYAKSTRDDLSGFELGY